MQGKRDKFLRIKTNNNRNDEVYVLPVIPEKCYFTIGEVGFLCGVKPHVLRYWEQEFFQIKPVKRRGNRRYYQYKDIVMIRQIRKLLYESGFTIEGARLQLALSSANIDQSMKADVVVKKMIADLEMILQSLKTS